MTNGEEARPRSSASRARRPSWRHNRWTILATQLGILVIFLGSWQFGLEGKNVVFFGKPTLIAERFAELFADGEIYGHIEITLTEIVIGYLIGASLGLVFGFVLGRSRFLSETFQPYILAFYSIPRIALAPLFIVWFGLGIESKIAIVVLTSFFLVFFNTYAGLQNINEELVRLARLMGASRWQTILRVTLPSASHSIIIGLKTAVPYAVIGAIIGEYIGADRGLGFFILEASQTFDAPGMFSGIIILVLFVVVANHGLTMIERRALRWRPATQEALQV